MSKCRVCYLPVGVLIGGCHCATPSVYASGERAAEIAATLPGASPPNGATHG
jgi:hypothetical protein